MNTRPGVPMETQRKDDPDRVASTNLEELKVYRRGSWNLFEPCAHK